MEQMTTQLYNQVRQELLDYVVEMHFNHYAGAITFDTLLLKLGIIDSLSMMTFVLFLEQKYGLDFFTVDISRDDFTNINTLAALVVKNTSGAN
jgi:acyl carrier protein